MSPSLMCDCSVTVFFQMLNSLGLFFLNNVLDKQFLHDFYGKLYGSG